MLSSSVLIPVRPQLLLVNETVLGKLAIAISVNKVLNVVPGKLYH